MTLLAQQRAFIAEISGDDDTAPSSPGMAIYRNAYRARLFDALAVNFEKTRCWVGEDAFAAAAAHYILAYPSANWTLDAFGREFPDLLADLFVDDGEVAELAWLEWQMQQAFAAHDRPELDAGKLAEAGLTGDEWAGLRFTMAAGFASRSVVHDVGTFWYRQSPGTAVSLADQPELIVWRKAFQPHFRLLETSEWRALASLVSGAPLGACAQDPTVSAERLGNWLAQWLEEGLFSGFVRS